MHYYDHALLSAKKFKCDVNDTLKLHKVMDSSKFYMPISQHRLFSHNTWFIQVLTDLIGEVVPNTLTGEMLSVRDVLYEHCKEDHNGRVPSIQDWLQCLKFDVPDEHRIWFNNPRLSDKMLLNTLRVEQSNPK